MKGLVLNAVFCILLIPIFIFVATPAMAIVEIGVTGTFTDDVAETNETNERQIVVKLEYSKAPDPKPTTDDVTSLDYTFGEGTDNDPKTYFITFSEIPPGALLRFTLLGYHQVRTTGSTSGVTFTYNDDPSNPASIAALPGNKLVRDTDYLPGLGYAIIAANNDAIAADVFPTLPTINPPNTIIKVQWGDVSEELSMPDLHNLFFAGGGTLNLRVNERDSINRLGSKKADDTYDDDHGRNQRQVVINEVMWAYDDSYLGTPEEHVREHWIELYNRFTTPIKFSDIKLSTSKEYPSVPAETDMLTNALDFVNTWEIDDKGQHGQSQTPRREFRSMQRVDYDNGWDSDHWSIATSLFLRNYRGTPGKQNLATRVPTARRPPAQDNPAQDKIIINEIGNSADDTLDWIELRNVTGSAQSLNNWALTITTGFGNETEIVRFPNYSIEARGVLLIVNGDPVETPLSVGFDISQAAADQAFGAGPHRYLIVDNDQLAIPNDDGWLLILRSNTPWDVGEGRDVYQTGYRAEDVAGPGALHTNFVVLDLRKATPSLEKQSDGKDGGDIWNTKVFPLNGNLQVDGAFLQSDRLNTPNTVWVRDGTKQGYLKDAWQKPGFIGIGYDRSVQTNDQYSGSPGYDNNIARSRLAQLDGGRLIVSELMLTTADNSSPQWIELYNTSKRVIDLAADDSAPNTGWQLIVENHESGSWKEDRRNLNITVNLKDLFTYILPRQTVLIVAYKGRVSDIGHFPDSRVGNIFENYQRAFSMANREDLILNAAGGFYIKIVDGDGTVSDEVGNLDGDPPNPRFGLGLDDPYSWNWPTGLTEDGFRSSLIRRRDANGRPRIAIPNRAVDGDLTGAVLPMGTKRKRNRWPKYAWVHAVDTAFYRVQKTWYGSRYDTSTPGYIRGIQLPVSLSFFRATLESGEVVIRWTTESETDNAGFNILRSHRQDGKYKQINSELIQGAGTTGERNTYKWVDPTARVGVVYYYQIEDVSFAGERQMLTTSRLKGYISAKNKLTTTWSELKSLR